MSDPRMLDSPPRAQAGPILSRVAQESIRYRLAIRLGWYEAHAPRALDLLADLHAGLYAAMHGHATALRGAYPVRHWIAVLWGDRDLGTKDLCRLALSPHPRARAAIQTIVERLAAALGCRLEPLVASIPEPHIALGNVAHAAGELQRELAFDLRDGQLNEHERADLRPDVQRTKAALADVEALTMPPLAHTIRTPRAAREARP